MRKINLCHNYFGEGHHFLGYSIGSDGYSGMGWKEDQVQKLVELLKLPKVFLDGEKVEITEEQYAQMGKLWNSFRKYKLVDNGNDKKIAYPEDMQDELVQELEKARKNKSFVTLTVGDMNTGQAWGDLYDTKGRIGLSRGREYLFPLLVSFKKGEYDEDLDIEVGESYDFLSEMSTKDIAKYLDSESLEFDEVLNSGGTIIGSVVAVRTGLEKTRIVYKHPNFKPKETFENVRIETETLTTVCTITNNRTGETKESQKETTKWCLFVNEEAYSRHNSKEDLEKYLRAIKEINLI